MFSDCLALAFMALVFIFALACIMLEEERGSQEREKEWPEAIAKIINLLLGEGPTNTVTTKVTTRVEKSSGKTAKFV